MKRVNYLFRNYDLQATLDDRLAKIYDKVTAIPRDQFLASGDDEIIEHIRADLLIEQLTIYEDNVNMVQKEIEIDVSNSKERNPYGMAILLVPGFRVTVSIPFSGDPELWNLKPSPYYDAAPKGIVHKPGTDGIGYLEMVFEQPADAEPERLKSEIDKNIGLVKKYLAFQKKDIDHRNAQLEGLIVEKIQARRDRLEKQDGLAKMIGIPLRHREGAPKIKPIKIQKRIVHPLPPPPKSSYKPEPGILDSDYEDILTIIRHEGRTFETTPSTYKVHDEEDLRNILLAHLNGHYKGSATGETFRSRGKTDIRIEDADRAAFVAECKVWKGSKKLTDAVDQLLGYLTWRDCKCAIIVFNKHSAKFSEILTKVPATLKRHEQIYRDHGEQKAGEWRFTLTADEDEARRIILHVFLFNLYTSTQEG